VASVKKLQVFVSSTYTDLRDERQAAVAAILAAGHIPAGMELFAAGDEEQLTVIRRWIDESDVFMLILGSRYGSIEPQTSKSYVQLEYEYALSTHKPLFAVVKELSSTAEPEFEAFKTLVLQKMVRFWRESIEIKLAIYETLAEFSRRAELTGWVKPDTVVNVGAISEEVARLSRENAALRERLSATSPRTFNGLTFEELFRLLSTTRLEIVPQDKSELARLQAIAAFFEHERAAPIHLLWYLSAKLVHRATVAPPLQPFASPLEEAGLVKYTGSNLNGKVYEITDVGRQFLLCMRNARDMTFAEDLRA
jgi:hypothetical protein